MDYKLLDHQKEALEFIKARERAFLHADIGTGKSLVAIEAFKMFPELNPIIITKKSTFVSWEIELEKFAPELKPKMYSTESFSVRSYGQAREDDFVVLDESSLVKNHTSKRSKAIQFFCSRAKRVLIMSGSALTKNPLDIFSQAKVLGILYDNCNTFNKFRDQFADVMRIVYPGCRYPAPVIKGFKNLDIMKDWMSEFTLEIRREDVLDLPKRTFMRRYCYPKTKPTLEDYGIEGDEIALVKLQKMCMYESKHKAKMKELEDLLEELGNQKVIIFTYYQESINEICKVLKDRKFVVFDGRTSLKNKKIAVDKFVNGDSQFFVGSYAAAEGLNLTSTCVCVFVGLTYSLDKMAQSAGRLFRKGQEKPVTYITLIGGRAESAMFKALQNKVTINTEVTRVGIDRFLEEGEKDE